MKFGRMITAGALPCLLMLAIALTPIGCGGSMTTSSGMSTTSTAASTAAPSPSTTVSAQKQAAEAYFTIMAPTIAKDYQGDLWAFEAGEQWARKYGRSMNTSLTAWTAMLPTFEQAVAKEQAILQGYKAITSPPAFETAHAALLANNEGDIAQFKELIAAIKAKRPASELMAMLRVDPSPTNAQVLADFQAAASSVGISLPANLINAYQDDTSSGLTTS